MKLIYGPSVHVVGRQEVAAAELDHFLAHHGVSWRTDTDVGSEALCETAGRVCYMSFARPRPGGNAAYLDHIKEVGHGSVLEHAAWNFIVSGVSRSLTHELVRHRAGWAYSQLSQRYVDESVAEYVVPPDLAMEVRAARLRRFVVKGSGWLADGSWGAVLDSQSRRGNHTEAEPTLTGLGVDEFHALADAGEIWLDAIEKSQAAYVWLAGHLAHKAEKSRPDLAKTDSRKYARQAARSVLPNATETKVFCTANARALRHFFEMRASRHADPEIRALAVRLWEAIVAEAPNLFSDYTKVELPDGSCELTTTHRKV